MQQTTYKSHGKAVIRAPLYSCRKLFIAGKETRKLDDVVPELLNDPLFLEGLYWSSPQLYQTVLAYKNGTIHPSRIQKLLHTLKKYTIRSATRCTPYGIYAGCALAEADTATDTQEVLRERKVRVDMALLQQLVKQIETDPVLWRYLKYQVNNSVYSFSGQYRFTGMSNEEGKSRFQVNTVARTAAIEKILQLAQQRSLVSVDELCALQEEEAGGAGSECFIKELISRQLLVSELQPGLTRNSELTNIQHVLERLKQQHITGVEKYLRPVKDISRLLKLFASLPPGILPLQEIQDLKTALFTAGIDAEQSHLFHADLKQIVPAPFPFSAIQDHELEKAMMMLGKLTAAVSPQERQLEQFKKRFAEKYETQEIPLAEALDPELGIGFPATDRIGDVTHASFAEKIQPVSREEGTGRTVDCHAWLRDIIEGATPALWQQPVHLQDKDLEGLDDKLGQLANQVTVMGTLLPSGKILLQHIGGAHANALLGRFAHLDEKMHEYCTALAASERQTKGQVVFAELVHIPEGRVGNIARRPALSAYEIPILASAADARKQLPVADLMLSVQQGELVLRSKKLDMRVVPRLSNAHNYMNSPVAAYKFLAAIQHQGKPGLEINWGTMPRYKRFLPRISYKKFILHRAAWLMQESDIRAIKQSKDPLGALRSFLSRWQVSRFVSFCEGDNELFIDTQNEDYLQLLLTEIKECRFVKLCEWLHDEGMENASPGYAFIRQFILPLTRTNSKKPRPHAHSSGVQLQRYFEPGTEWAYFKIYCSAKMADSILRAVIKPVADWLLQKDIADKLFFIRYTDPHYHIRFRVHLTANAQAGKLAALVARMQEALHPFLQSREVWRLELDTYQREIERYSEEAMMMTEEVFFRDSLVILACMEYADFEKDQDIRLLAAVKNMDKWLYLFNMTGEERIDFCADMCKAFSYEFGNESKRRLDVQYREWRSRLAHFMEADRFDTLLDERSVKLGQLSLPAENITSYIHMSMNRWFAADQRLMEYMIYHFCEKYYRQSVYHTNAPR